jgi:geranylgeranyl diphosphate synthase, type I
MSLSQYMLEMRPEIEEALQEIVEDKIPGEYRGMKEMLRYHLGWEGKDAGPEAQGKRVRPFLLLLCTASNGVDWRRALPCAAAVELLHNFSLIHDDIEDHSEQRHGRDTLWKKWGIPQAINAGDLMFTLAQTAILDMSKNVPVALGLQMARLFNDTCVRLTGGQYLDISYESEREIAIDAYWPMIAGKTAALLRGCAGLGALAAQVERDRYEAYLAFGFWLGQAFQVQDDYLGIWGDVELTGKPVDSDLALGKKSLPVLYGLARRGAFYRRWMEGAIQPEEAAPLAQLLEAEGARQFTLEKADELTRQALEALEIAICNTNEACLALRDMADLLLRRQN